MGELRPQLEPPIGLLSVAELPMAELSSFYFISQNQILLYCGISSLLEMPSFLPSHLFKDMMFVLSDCSAVLLSLFQVAGRPPPDPREHF